MPYRRKQRIRMEGWMDRKQRIEWIEWIGEGKGDRMEGRTNGRTDGFLFYLYLSTQPYGRIPILFFFFYLPILTFWRTTLLPTYLLILLTYLPTETDSHPSIPPFSYSPYHSPKPPNLLINPSFSPSSLLPFSLSNLSLSFLLIHPIQPILILSPSP